MAKLQTEEKIYDLWFEYKQDCIKNKRLPTKNMWLNILDITRQTYSRWKVKSDAIKDIDKQIEDVWVQKLHGKHVAGIIFYLKNAFHYRDRQDHDLTSGGKPIPIYGGKAK